jgi:enoyl-CoA hydratase/carnithine racemase
MSSYSTFRVESIDEGKIVRVNISRPKALNAMNMPFFTELT